ncbi:MAG TPA: hypothetical protein VGN34_32030 [Ktedonobacteraceae bacterium]|jgi:hypothetical protein
MSNQGLHQLRGDAQYGTEVFDWPRTSKDPFEGKWELILSLVLAHPEWSGSDLFEEMQRLFPGCYRSSQQSTLHHGLRKIRARLLSSMQELWPQEVIQRNVPIPVVAGSDQREQEADGARPRGSSILGSPSNLCITGTSTRSSKCGVASV